MGQVGQGVMGWGEARWVKEKQGKQGKKIAGIRQNKLGKLDVENSCMVSIQLLLQQLNNKYSSYNNEIIYIFINSTKTSNTRCSSESWSNWLSLRFFLYLKNHGIQSKSLMTWKKGTLHLFLKGLIGKNWKVPDGQPHFYAQQGHGIDHPRRHVKVYGK